MQNRHSELPESSVFQPSSYLLAGFTRPQTTPTLPKLAKSHKTLDWATESADGRSIYSRHSARSDAFFSSRPIPPLDVDPSKLFSLTAMYLEGKGIDHHQNSEGKLHFNTPPTHTEFMDIFSRCKTSNAPRPKKTDVRAKTALADSRREVPVKKIAEIGSRNAKKKRREENKMSIDETILVQKYLDENCADRTNHPKTLLDWQLQLSSAEKVWDPKQFKVKK